LQAEAWFSLEKENTMDLIVYFLIALAVQYGGYRIFISYRDAARQLQRDEDMRNTRPRGGLGVAYIGGSDRPGEN
jgi:hypothetical protein